MNITLPVEITLTECGDTGYIPSLTEFFEDLSFPERLLVWLSCVLTTVTVLIYLENVHLILRLHQSPSLDRRATVWILSVMPLTSLSAAMNMCLPRSAALPDFVASVAFALGVLHFKMEVMDHFGGTDLIVRALQSVEIPLSSPPFCYFRSCCPSFYLTRFKYRLISCCVLQSAVLQPLTAFCYVIIFMEDNYRYRQMTTQVPIFYFILVRCGSTLLATHGISLVVAATRSIWQPLDMAPKHLILKTWLGLVNIQGLVFSLLVLHGIPPCTGRISSRVRGKATLSVVLVLEILVVTLLTRSFYHNSDLISPDCSEHARSTHDPEHQLSSGTDLGSSTSEASGPEDAIPWPTEEISDSSFCFSDSSVAEYERRHSRYGATDCTTIRPDLDNHPLPHINCETNNESTYVTKKTEESRGS